MIMIQFDYVIATLFLTTGSLVYSQVPSYTSLGCWADQASAPALRSNEEYGFYDRAPAYRTSPSAINTCAQIAQRFQHNVFALQAGACYSMWDVVPNGFYSRYGKKNCPKDGLGASLVNHVYQINGAPNYTPNYTALGYVSLGCWRDNNNGSARTMKSLEGFNELDGEPRKRLDAINKCFRAASYFNLTVFGIADGGYCRGAVDVVPGGTYASIGNSSYCPGDGKGASFVNHVYQLKNAPKASSNNTTIDQSPSGTFVFESLGCWNDEFPSNYDAVRSRWRIPRSDADPIGTCARHVASSTVTAGANVFALQTTPGDPNTLRCSAQRDIVPGGHYTRYGAVTSCPMNGTGGIGINHVYQIKNAAKLEFDWQALPYTSLGCFRTPAKSATYLADSIQQCYETTLNLGFSVFTITKMSEVWHICSPAEDFVPGGKYAEFGPATLCRYDGMGEEDIQHVYYLNRYPAKFLRLWDLPKISQLTPYAFTSLGCFDFSFNFAVLSDVHYSLLPIKFRNVGVQGPYLDTGGIDPHFCHELAIQRRHNIFAIVNNELCYTSSDVIASPNFTSPVNSFSLLAEDSGWYDEITYPTVTPQQVTCPSQISSVSRGKVTQIFQVNNALTRPDSITISSNWNHVGCYWYDNASAAQLSNEGKSNILDGDPISRFDAISKCYQVAKSLNHTAFALQLGGICLSSSDSAQLTQYGSFPYPLCLNDMRGGAFVARYSEYSNIPPRTGINVFQIIV